MPVLVLDDGACPLLKALLLQQLEQVVPKEGGVYEEPEGAWCQVFLCLKIEKLDRLDF